jgi:NADP-dependent 3-hydroxy acid dehydrogenase YdfG
LRVSGRIAASRLSAPAVRSYRAIPPGSDATARAVRYAVEQPEEVDVNEIAIRPTAATH